MTEHRLTKLFEHNNWANEQILSACAALSDEQLDATPASATLGSIRETLIAPGGRAAELPASADPAAGAAAGAPAGTAFRAAQPAGT